MKLLIDLLLRTGSFETDASRAAKTAKRRATEIERAFSDAGRKLKGVFAGLAGGIGIASLMRTFAQETINAQNEQAQLAAAIQSTGKAAGFSVDDLNKMADAMAKVSTFDAGEINRAQTRLLSYTGIVGEKFPEAMQATIDMATRMGMSVEQSAETIGRALDVPSQGLAALSKQGFRFTEEQKKAVEQLEKTGRVAEAQGIILAALESSYGGAAAAARNTFGGAVMALQAELRSLMTGGDGSLDGARDAIESLVRVMGDPSTRQAFNSLTAGFATLIEWSVKAASNTVWAVNKVLEQIDRLKGIAPPQDLLTDWAKSRLGELDAPKPGAGLTEDQIKKLAAERAAAEARLKAGNAAGKQADAYIETLKRQLQATRELTVVEKTLEEIRGGSLRGAGAKRQDQALGLAALLDADAAALKRAAEAEEEMQALIQRRESIYEEGKRVFESTRTPIEQLDAQIVRLNTLLSEGAITWDTYARAVFAAQDNFDEANKKVDEAAERTKDAAKELGMTFSSAFEDAIVEGKKFSEVLKGLEQDILRIITRKLVTEPLANALTGAMGGSGFFGSIFGGAKAGGGDVIAGRSYLVGEQGPERFVPRTAGTIIPNQATQGQSSPVNVTFNVSTPDVESFRRSEAQIKSRMMGVVQGAGRFS